MKEIIKRCFSASTSKEALELLELAYIFGNFSPTIYNKVKNEIYKEYKKL